MKSFHEYVKEKGLDCPVRVFPNMEYRCVRDEHELKDLPFSEKLTICFATGLYDNFAGIIKGVDTDGTVRYYLPADTMYFSFFAALLPEFSGEQIMNDIISVFYRMTDRIDDSVFLYIDTVFSDEKYGGYGKIARFGCKIMYYGCVAEEHYRSPFFYETKFGAKIKMYALYQFLVKGISVKDAANFGKFLKAEDIEDEIASNCLAIAAKSFERKCDTIYDEWFNLIDWRIGSDYNQPLQRGCFESYDEYMAWRSESPERAWLPTSLREARDLWSSYHPKGHYKARVGNGQKLR